MSTEAQEGREWVKTYHGLSDHDIDRFNAVNTAIPYIAHAEYLHPSVLDPKFGRQLAHERHITITADAFVVKVWKGFIWGAVREANSEGLYHEMKQVLSDANRRTLTP